MNTSPEIDTRTNFIFRPDFVTLADVFHVEYLLIGYVGIFFFLATYGFADSGR